MICARPPSSRVLAAALLAFLLAGGPRPATAADGAEAAPQLPATLGLEAALRIFRQRGFDLLVAEANVISAEGDFRIANAFPNPGLSFAAGRNYNCSSSQDCSVVSYSAGVSDNLLVSNLLSGKRGLRREVAQLALAAARKTRADAQRTLEFQLKSNFMQALLARAQLENAKETQLSNARTRELNARKYALGAISDADLAKVDVAALEAEQAVDQATQVLRSAKLSVAFLLGFRSLVPDFELDAADLDYRLPGPVATASREALLRDALARRPDLAAQAQQVRRAQASLSLASRGRIPDVGLSFSYTANGSGETNISPPNGAVGLSFNAPFFYFQSGEIRKAEADLITQQVLRQKLEAQLVADVENAWAQVTATRKLVERMQGGLLDRAKTARDLVAVQYEKGAASLLELLDAQRTYTAVRTEHAQDLANFWIAVAQLEQATASELRP